MMNDLTEAHNLNDPVDRKRLEAVLRRYVPGPRVLWKPSCASTNEELMNLARAGERGWVLLGTDRQSEGRGRHRRRWVSPLGGLYLSVLPPLLPEESPITLVPLAVGLALSEALRDEAVQRGGELDPRLKWPNDIFARRGKLAGVLCETIKEEDGWLVVAGVGINLRPLSLENKRLIVDEVTSLDEEADLGWTRSGLIVAFIRRLSERLRDWKDRPEKLRRDWLAAADFIGKTVRVKTGDAPVEGVAEGIDENGGLLLQTSGGTTTINAAEGIEVLDE